MMNQKQSRLLKGWLKKYPWLWAILQYWEHHHRAIKAERVNADPRIFLNNLRAGQVWVYTEHPQEGPAVVTGGTGMVLTRIQNDGAFVKYVAINAAGKGGYLMILKPPVGISWSKLAERAHDLLAGM